MPIDPALVQFWLDAKDNTKMTQAIEATALQQLLASLGDGEVGSCELGTLTFKEQTRKGYDVPAATFRVPRFQKAKEGR